MRMFGVNNFVFIDPDTGKEIKNVNSFDPIERWFEIDGKYYFRNYLVIDKKTTELKYKITSWP